MHGSFHFGKVKTRVILIEGGFNTPTKEIESQDLLLPDPRSKEVQWAEGRAVFCSRSQAGDREGDT